MTWFKTPEQLSDEHKAKLVKQLETKRKEVEAEGVTVNGVRYAGYPGNRQALAESLEYANASGNTTFAGWKDSDGGFHADHPVADVQAAYEAIGANRSALIDREGQYAAQVMAGTLESVDGLDWTVD